MGAREAPIVLGGILASRKRDRLYHVRPKITSDTHTKLGHGRRDEVPPAVYAAFAAAFTGPIRPQRSIVRVYALNARSLALPH